MEIKHTPTPYQARGSYVMTSDDAHAVIIAHCFHQTEITGRNAQANAEFIAQACNEIDALPNLRVLLETAGMELEKAITVQEQLVEALKAVQHAAFSTNESVYLPHKVREQVAAALDAAGVA